MQSRSDRNRALTANFGFAFAASRCTVVSVAAEMSQLEVRLYQTAWEVCADLGAGSKI